MEKKDIILELKNVNKMYDESLAVENFNLYVQAEISRENLKEELSLILNSNTKKESDISKDNNVIYEVSNMKAEFKYSNKYTGDIKLTYDDNIRYGRITLYLSGKSSTLEIEYFSFEELERLYSMIRQVKKI